MNPIFFIAALLISYTCDVASLLAAPSKDSLESHRQPDGSKIELRLSGDDWLHWLETDDGYTVVRRDDGAYVYVVDVNDGKLVGSQHLVGKVDPKTKGIRPGIFPILDLQQSSETSHSLTDAASCAEIEYPNPRDSFANLVLLARFSDHASRTLPTQSDINIIYNQVGGDPVIAPSGSVRDVYDESSYGVCQPVSTVNDWVNLAHDEMYYSEGRGGRGPLNHLEEGVRETLDIVASTVDFSTLDTNLDGYVDCLSFLHSGYGSEAGGEDPLGKYAMDRIWSRYLYLDPPWVAPCGMKICRVAVCPGLFGHQGSDPTRIGVLSHEIGHVLRLPDMYDNRARSLHLPAGHGIGSWGIMGNCWGFDQSQLYPSHFSPYSKIFLGWVSPIEIANSGKFSIRAVEQESQIYKLASDYPAGEYLLIENRQPLGFDQKIPSSSDGTGGLAIWHIDENQPGNRNYAGYPGMADWPKYHYKFAILQADGMFELERRVNKGNGTDLFRGTLHSQIGPSTIPATSGYQSGVLTSPLNSIKNISASSAAMTFEVDIEN